MGSASIHLRTHVSQTGTARMWSQAQQHYGTRNDTIAGAIARLLRAP